MKIIVLGGFGFIGSRISYYLKKKHKVLQVSRRNGFDIFKKNKIRNCIRTPELEDNFAMHNLWKNFNPVVHKRRRTYKKDL